MVKEHAHWRQPEMRAKIDTQSRMDPGAPFMMDGRGPVLSAWVAGERSRILGRELTQSEERIFSGLANKAKVGELGAREHFRVFSLV